jgi:hypothetical protein
MKSCQSGWNTPLLPVQKPTLLQDFQADNQATVTLHPFQATAIILDLSPTGLQNSPTVFKTALTSDL